MRKVTENNNTVLIAIEQIRGMVKELDQPHLNKSNNPSLLTNTSSIPKDKLHRIFRYAAHLYPMYDLFDGNSLLNLASTSKQTQQLLNQYLASERGT